MCRKNDNALITKSTCNALSIPFILTATHTILLPILTMYPHIGLCSAPLQKPNLRYDDSGNIINVNANILSESSSLCPFKHGTNYKHEINCKCKFIISLNQSKPKEITSLIMSFLEKSKPNKEELIDQNLILDYLYDMYNSINPFILDNLKTDRPEFEDINIFLKMLHGIECNTKKLLLEKLYNVINVTSKEKNEEMKEIIDVITTTCLRIIIMNELINNDNVHESLCNPVEWENELLSLIIKKKMNEFIDQSKKTQNNKKKILADMFHFFEDKLVMPCKIYNGKTKELIIPHSVRMQICSMLEKKMWYENNLEMFHQIFSHVNVDKNQIKMTKNKLVEITFMLLWEILIRGNRIKRFGHQSEIIMGIVSTMNNKYLDVIQKTTKTIQESTISALNYTMTIYNPFFNVSDFKFCGTENR